MYNSNLKERLWFTVYEDDVFVSLLGLRLKLLKNKTPFIVWKTNKKIKSISLLLMPMEYKILNEYLELLKLDINQNKIIKIKKKIEKM